MCNVCLNQVKTKYEGRYILDNFKPSEISVDDEEPEETLDFFIKHLARSKRNKQISLFYNLTYYFELEEDRGRWVTVENGCKKCLQGTDCSCEMAKYLKELQSNPGVLYVFVSEVFVREPVKKAKKSD